MKLEKITVSILSHFSKLSQGSDPTSIVVKPSDPQILVASSATRSVVALARNIQPFESELSLFRLSNFVSSLELFKDVDYNLEFSSSQVKIVSEGRNFEQTIDLDDPEVLTVPDSTKVLTYLEDKPVEVEFELTDYVRSKIEAGAKKNNVSGLLFEGKNGEIVLTAANVSLQGAIEKTASRFSVKTGQKTDREFSVGVLADDFSKITSGDYHVGISRTFVRFIAPPEAYVSYVLTTQQYSKI